MFLPWHACPVHKLQIHVARNERQMLFWDGFRGSVGFSVRLQNVDEHLQIGFPSLWFAHENYSWTTTKKDMVNTRFNSYNMYDLFYKLHAFAPKTNNLKQQNCLAILDL